MCTTGVHLRKATDITDFDIFTSEPGPDNVHAHKVFACWSLGRDFECELGSGR